MRFIIAIAAALLAAQPSLACSPAPDGGDRVKEWDTAKAAKGLFQAATNVELATVERFTPDFDFAQYGPSSGSVAEQREAAREEGAARIHYVVERRYKGLGSTRFTLNGTTSSHLVKERGPVREASLPWLSEVVDLKDGGVFGGDCRVAVYARVGQRYLIFRDARGRVLNKGSLDLGEDEHIEGPAYVPIHGAGDPWLVAVERAAGLR